MTSEERFAFTRRKWFKNIVFVVCCALMIALGLFCATHDFSGDFRRRPNYLVHPIGWIGVIFFGYALLYMLYKNIVYAFKGRGMVEITEEGLWNRDSFIPWESIVSIRGNKYYILIETSDTKERLQRASWLTKLNYKSDGVVERISNWDFDGSQEVFIERCIPYLKTK